MKKNYSVSQVVRTIVVEVDKDIGKDHVNFEFVIMVIAISGNKFKVNAYRNETLAVATLSGDKAHEEILVRDFALLDDVTFSSEKEAIKRVTDRLDELFG
jgi:hypothetical protein